MEKLEKSKNFISSQMFAINPEPIMVYTLPIEKHIKYKKEIQLILDNIPEDLNQKSSANPYLEHVCNTENQNIFNSFPQLNELKSDIRNMALNFIKEIGFLCDEIIINSAWANKAKKDATLAFHRHANAYVSGNYFVNFNPEVHTCLNFSNDRHHSQKPLSQTIELTAGEPTVYNNPFAGVVASEGQIVIWRSHMVHGYHTLNGADGRMTLSVNAMPAILSGGDYEFAVSEIKA